MTIHPYDPAADAALNFPEWRVVATYLAGIPEVICHERRLILIDPGRSQSEDMAVARGVAHLHLGHHLSEREFTEDEMALALTRAQIMMQGEYTSID